MNSEMLKVKGFLLRSISCILILILMIISAVLTLYTCRLYSYNGVFLLMMVLGDALVPLLLFSPALIFRSKFLALSAIICSLFNIFVRLFSMIIFKETFMPLNYESLKMLLVHSDLYSVEAVLGRGFYFWLVPILLLMMALITIVCIIGWKSSGKRFGKVIKAWTLFFCILLLFSVVSNSIFIIERPDRNTSVLINTVPLLSAKILDDAMRDAFRENVYVKKELSEKSREILENCHMIDRKDKIANIGECKFDRIIIIAVESLDYNFIGGINPRMPENVTPNLDCFCRNNLSLKNYFAASQPTSWGLNSLLMSRLDYERDRFVDVPSFFSVARQQGFYTAYYSSASGVFGNNRVIYDKLFDADEMFFLEEWCSVYKIPKETAWGIADNELLDGVYSELKKIRQKRFAVLISTMDTHPPYYAPEKEDGAENNDPEGKFRKNPDVLSNKFLRALHHTDHCIGMFVKRIMNDKELFDERTMIIITADHSATHGENYLKRTELNPDRIPLIFIVKDHSVLKGIDPEKFASSIDLAPTLLELIGMDVPESFMGRSLFSEKNLAVCRTWGDVLLLHNAEGLRTVNCYEAADSPEKQAFIDFYFSHYFP